MWQQQLELRWESLQVESSKKGPAKRIPLPDAMGFYLFHRLVGQESCPEISREIQYSFLDPHTSESAFRCQIAAKVGASLLIIRGH